MVQRLVLLVCFLQPQSGGRGLFVANITHHHSYRTTTRLGGSPFCSRGCGQCRHCVQHIAPTQQDNNTPADDVCLEVHLLRHTVCWQPRNNVDLELPPKAAAQQHLLQPGLVVLFVHGGALLLSASVGCSTEQLHFPLPGHGCS